MVRAARVEGKSVGVDRLPRSFDRAGAGIQGRLELPVPPIVLGMGAGRKITGFHAAQSGSNEFLR